MTDTQTSITPRPERGPSPARTWSYRHALRAAFGERRHRHPGEDQALRSHQAATADDAAQSIADGDTAAIDWYRLMASRVLTARLKPSDQAAHTARSQARYLADLIDQGIAGRADVLRHAQADAICGDPTGLDRLNARPADEIATLTALVADLRAYAATTTDRLTVQAQVRRELDRRAAARHQHDHARTVRPWDRALRAVDAGPPTGANDPTRSPRSPRAPAPTGDLAAA